jgi:hypothetical protein
VTSKVEIGFCSKCGIIRQDGPDGPEFPCACFVKHHAEDCLLRLMISCPIDVVTCDVPLEEGECGMSNCAQHTECTCTVPKEVRFVCGGKAFEYERVSTEA